MFGPVNVSFNKIHQNSILVATISYKSLPDVDYVSIKVICTVTTPTIQEIVLTSIPYIYEPKTCVFYYKCLIPKHCLPSFECSGYKIEYNLQIEAYKDKEKSINDYPFWVLKRFNEFKYNIFLNNDMIRVDEDVDDNETAFSKVIEFLRNINISEINYSDHSEICKHYKKIKDEYSEKDTKFNTINYDIISKCSSLIFRQDGNIHISDNTDVTSDVVKEQINPLYDRPIKERLLCIEKYKDSIDEIFAKYKYKGDVFYYIKKGKFGKSKEVTYEIKQDKHIIFIVKHNRLFTKKLIIEIEYHRKSSITKIYLIRRINEKEEKYKIRQYDSNHMIYKKIEIKEDVWRNKYLSLKTKYFEVSVCIKIKIDDTEFEIYPEYVER